MWNIRRERSGITEGGALLWIKSGPLLWNNWGRCCGIIGGIFVE